MAQPTVSGSVATNESSETSRKSLGTVSLVAFVVAAAAPLTVLAVFAPLGLMSGGESLVAGYLITGVVYLIFAVGFTTMSRHFDGTGAFYAYISRGINKRWGAAAGLVAYLGYLGGQIGFTASAAVFTGAFLQVLFGIQLHWIWYAIAISVLAAFLSYRQVTVSAKVVIALLSAEMGILAIFCVGVLAAGGHEGITLSAFGPEAIFSAALPAVFTLTFVTFIGFEQTVVYSREVKDKRKTVAKATYIGVIVLTITYAFCSWVIIQAVGPSELVNIALGDPSQLVFALNDRFVGTGVTLVMQALVITSFFAGVLALQNTCGRYLQALGEQSVLPTALARASKTTGSPSTGTVVQGLLVVAALVIFTVIGSDPYTQVVPWTNTPTVVAVLANQVLASFAVVYFFKRDRRGESKWNTTIAPILSIVLISLALILMIAALSAFTGLGALGNTIMLLPLLAGAIYGYVRASMLERRGHTQNSQGAATDQAALQDA